MSIRARALTGAVAGLLALTMPAAAEVTAVASDGFTIDLSATVPLGREAAWQRLLDIGGWWSDAHTYSGSATAMQVDAVPGGCWCETWPGGEVEHGRVVLLTPNSQLRFRAELGPLQELAVSGALTFTLSDGGQPGETLVTVAYRVSGSSLAGLKTLAPVVDEVLAEQLTRLAAAP